jgi:cell division protein FtsW
VSGARESLGRPILAITLVLALLGMVMVFSASAVATASSADYGHDPFYFFKRQFIFFLCGLGAMLAVRRVDLLRWRIWLSLPLMLLSLVLLVAVLAVGPIINGAQRWLLLGPVQFQVAELAKVAVVFYLADCLARRRETLSSLPRLLPMFGLVGLTLALIELEPDLGTSLVVAAVFMTMLFMAGVPLRFLGMLSGLGVAVVLALVLHKPYRFERLANYLHPFHDIQGVGYQLYNGLLALASGGVWGVGIPNSHQKFNYLPEQHTDFIFAILGEEMGLVGCLAVLGLFALLLLAGFKLAVNCRRPYLALLAGGITFQVCFQAFLNVAVVTGSLPTTGIPLPLISYGGSSLFFTLVSLGVLLNISDYTARQVVAPLRQKERRRLRRGSTLATSSEDRPVPVSSGSWESEVRAARQAPPPPRLPRPLVEPDLSRCPPRRRRSREGLVGGGRGGERSG